MDRRTAVLLLHFGEPERPTLEHVVPFLERIFYTNAPLEGKVDEARARARSRELAEQRAPGLIAEYEEIGGSPLNRQAAEQEAGLAAELKARGLDWPVYTGMQFTAPLIEDAVARAVADGADRIVVLPVYPLCGPSTTVAALEQTARAVEQGAHDVELLEISGWHRHPAYVTLRADGVRETARAAGTDLTTGRTELVFSAHGTPTKYLKEGSRYDRYVNDNCRAVAAEVGVPEFTLGFQNHTNRPVEWTQPDIDAAIQALARREQSEAAAESGGWRGTGVGAAVDTVIVVPISFMHEQSETLAELDHELKEETEAVGLRFLRVPIPHADAAFIGVLADLVQARVDGDAGFPFAMRQCQCRPEARTRCLNFGEV